MHSSFAVCAGMMANPVTQSDEAKTGGEIAHDSKVKRRWRETRNDRTRESRGGSRWASQREGLTRKYIGHVLHRGGGTLGRAID